MAEERRADIHDKGNCSEAASNNLVDIEDTDSNDRLDILENEFHRIRSNKRTPSTKGVTKSRATKDNEEKYIDQANFNKAPLSSRGINSINEEKEPAQHTSDGHEETRLQNNDPQNSVSAKTSEDNDKEEGHYEELVCLVRQFYVERPINPSAIAYQNIETC